MVAGAYDLGGGGGCGGVVWACLGTGSRVRAGGLGESARRRCHHELELLGARLVARGARGTAGVRLAATVSLAGAARHGGAARGRVGRAGAWLRVQPRVLAALAAGPA